MPTINEWKERLFYAARSVNVRNITALALPGNAGKNAYSLTTNDGLDRVPTGTVFVSNNIAFVVLTGYVVGYMEVEGSRRVVALGAIPSGCQVTPDGLRALYANWSLKSKRLAPLDEDTVRAVFLAAAIVEGR